MRIRFLHTEGFRLSAIYAGVFAVSVTLLGGFLLLINDRAFHDQIAQSAQSDIAAIQNAYKSRGLDEAREIVGQLLAVPDNSDFLLLQQNSKKLAGNLPVMTPRTGEMELILPRPLNHHHILGVGAYLAPGLYAFSGSDLGRAHGVHERILHTLEWLFLAAIVIAIAGGALVSRSFLRRMDAMATACQAIMQGNMNTRIAVRGTQDELDRLADTINAMLTRISALMENLHQVVKDVAHDLRTPVTHLRHRLERARTESKTPEEYRKALEGAIAASDDVLALFSALLRIAEIEAGARRAGFARVDIAILLQHLNDVFAPVAEDTGHSFQARTGPDCTVLGDRELLIQLFSNLIENAIVHTPAGTSIVLSHAKEKDKIVVRLLDNGPGVPLAEHKKLFRPLYRREASRTRPGYGLGLSLVSAIAELHNGNIAISDGPGFGISISFPMPNAAEV